MSNDEVRPARLTAADAARPLWLYALISSLFALTFILGREPAWTSVLLHQLEALLFAGCAIAAPRVSRKRMSWVMCGVFAIATALVTPAAHLAGNEQLSFLAVLPLLTALTMPLGPLPVLGAGLSCFIAACILVSKYGKGTNPFFDLGTAIVIFVGATYGVHLLDMFRERYDALKKLQKTLVQQERLAALGEAAATVAHEVRNPLGAIANAAALMRKREQTSHELLGMIEEEVTSLDRLVHELLILARPMYAQRRTTNVSELLKRCAVIACESKPTHQVEIDAPAGPDALASADPDMLQLAVVNVLRNAIQASPPDGRVRVRCDNSPSRCLIVIEDEGPGIPPEHLDRLFEPFFTTRSTGTGLGLAIAKRVVEAHQGTIAVGAPAPGKGTRFEIGIPA